MKSRTLRADLLLLTTALIWGLSFVAQRLGMVHIGPFTFNGVRFALGALVLYPLVRRNYPDGLLPRGKARRIKPGGIFKHGPHPLVGKIIHAYLGTSCRRYISVMNRQGNISYFFD